MKRPSLLDYFGPVDITTAAELWPAGECTPIKAPREASKTWRLTAALAISDAGGDMTLELFYGPGTTNSMGTVTIPVGSLNTNNPIWVDVLIGVRLSPGSPAQGNRCATANGIVVASDGTVYPLIAGSGAFVDLTVDATIVMTGLSTQAGDALSTRFVQLQDLR